ncbi:hypothetical protein [Sediminitomix flava]|uniref:YXWGXW repeat-containing protein n=1 Tax=Sediminitomix flava TaxID=379075 RepID=A0A315ZF88_SEDFL|nr:hypothetical protein [Sediminitomix flava]PWJ43992.1 hypothetical protein BC781_101342 [Sediminitomix flava]
MRLRYLFTFILSILSFGVFAQEFDDLYFFEEDKITENKTPVTQPSSLEEPKFDSQSYFTPSVSTTQFDTQMEQALSEQYINADRLAQLMNENPDSTTTTNEGAIQEKYTKRTTPRFRSSMTMGVNSPFSPYNRTWGWFYDGFTMTGYDMWGRTIQYDPWSQMVYVYDPMNGNIPEVYSAWNVGMSMRARWGYSPYGFGFNGGFGYNPYAWGWGGGFGWGGFGHPYGPYGFGNPYMWAGNPFIYPPYGGVYQRPIRVERPSPRVIATRRQSNLNASKYPAKVRSELYRQNTATNQATRQNREMHNRRIGQNNTNNQFNNNSNYRSNTYKAPSSTRTSSSSMPSRRRR